MFKCWIFTIDLFIDIFCCVNPIDNILRAHIFYCMIMTTHTNAKKSKQSLHVICNHLVNFSFFVFLLEVFQTAKKRVVLFCCFVASINLLEYQTREKLLVY